MKIAFDEVGDVRRGRREVEEVAAVRDGFKMALLLLFFPVLPCLYSVLKLLMSSYFLDVLQFYCAYIYLHPVQSVPEMIL